MDSKKLKHRVLNSVPYVVPQGRLKPKKEPTFGKKPSNGSFGKKPSNGDFGKEVNPIGGQKKSGSSFKKKEAKIRRIDLVIKTYYSWISKHYQISEKKLDRHHWRARSEIGRNDFFLTLLDHNYHIDVVHGEISPKGFIAEVGELKLLNESWDMMNLWVTTGDNCSDHDKAFFGEMLRQIKADGFKNTIAITREFALEMHFNRGG